MALSGIKYIVDEKGRRTAVVIELDKYAEELEEFLDYLDCLEREKEPDLSAKEFKNKLCVRR